MAHNVILELIGGAHILDEPLAGFFGFGADSARAVVNLTDVQLLAHFLAYIGAEGAKQWLPEHVFLSTLIWLSIDFHSARPLANAQVLFWLINLHDLLTRLVDHGAYQVFIARLWVFDFFCLRFLYYCHVMSFE